VTATGACLFVLSVATTEAAAWSLLVPSTLSPGTFLLVNALTAGMFGVGLASAANGLPTKSVGQLLYETDHDAPTR
jgi:hypothetical protein